jgi:ArsR family transcriptional regulator, arsenate/arsenite/antimonite-responsive transcriptional repressor
VRVRIVRLLAGRGGCACGEIVDQLPLAQATVSQHLRVLTDAGLLRASADGSRIDYCLQGDALERLAAALEALRPPAAACLSPPITSKDSS